MTENKRAAVAILARDCERNLPRNIEEIRKLEKGFAACEVLVLENDSRDRTKEILRAWEQEDKCVTLISRDMGKAAGGRTGSTASRIERMVFLRNQYLDYFRQKPDAFDYLIVVDIDLDRFRAWDILSAIERAPAGFAGLFANGRFYTTIAGRTIVGNFYDNTAFLPKDSPFVGLTYEEVRLNNDRINRELEEQAFVPCDSAFGGVGIYDFAAALSSRYETQKNDRSTYYENTIEHVLFNAGVRRCGELYVVRDLLVLYERQSPAKTLSRLPFKQSTMLWVYKRILRRTMPV